jgi:hypothetical protein
MFLYDFTKILPLFEFVSRFNTITYFESYDFTSQNVILTTFGQTKQTSLNNKDYYQNSSLLLTTLTSSLKLIAT